MFAVGAVELADAQPQANIIQNGIPRQQPVILQDQAGLRARADQRNPVYLHLSLVWEAQPSQ